MRVVTFTLAAAVMLAALGCGTAPETAMPAASSDSTKPGSPATPAATAATQSAGNLPRLWDFAATWCPPCGEQKPIIEELQKEFAGKIEIKSIDVDENKELAGEYEVKAIPTLVFIDAAGKELSRHVGLWPKDSILAQFKVHGFTE